MNNICNRRVMVTKYQSDISIMLTWNEEGAVSEQEFYYRQFSFTNPETFKSVESAVSALVDQWIKVFISDFHMAAVSKALDTDPQRFDQIVETAGNNGYTLLQIMKGE